MVTSIVFGFLCLTEAWISTSQSHICPTINRRTDNQELETEIELASPLSWTYSIAATAVTANAAERARQYLNQARLDSQLGAPWPACHGAVEGWVPASCTVAVIGAGTMGQGIAQCAAAASYRTVLLDAQPQALQRASARIHASWGSAV